jgi:integrase
MSDYQEYLSQVKDASRSIETKKAITKNWGQYQKWAKLHQFSLLPPKIEILEKYLLHLMAQKQKISTIEQAKWAIDWSYKTKGYPDVGQSENIKVILKGMRRVLGNKKQKKSALTIEHIAKIDFPDNLIGIRDKALLLVGFSGALRRSELANLNFEDIEWENFGLRLHLKKSKSNQEGKEEFVNIISSQNLEICPVEALKKWIANSKILSGTLFRSINKAGVIGSRISTTTIGKKVKWSAKIQGLNEKDFGGHSLRAGCATYLLAKKVPLNIVSKHLRHKKLDTTLQYDRNTTVSNLKGIY